MNSNNLNNFYNFLKIKSNDLVYRPINKNEIIKYKYLISLFNIFNISDIFLFLIILYLIAMLNIYLAILKCLYSQLI